MTVMTSWDLFYDLRSAQDEILRMSRMPRQWLGQFGQQPGVGPRAQACAPPLHITERNTPTSWPLARVEPNIDQHPVGLTSVRAVTPTNLSA